MKLIENWKDAYKMYSVWFFIIIGVFPDLYATLVQQNLIDIMPIYLAYGLKGLAGLGILARLLQQGKLNSISDVQEALKPILENKKEEVKTEENSK